jgi:hypothetical protein
MRGSSGPESSSPTLLGIRASIRCSSGFLSPARICSLCKINQYTSITAMTALRNVTMVINQIMNCARARSDHSAGLLREGPSLLMIFYSECECEKNTVLEHLSDMWITRKAPAVTQLCGLNTSEHMPIPFDGSHNLGSEHFEALLLGRGTYIGPNQAP